MIGVTPRSLYKGQGTGWAIAHPVFLCRINLNPMLAHSKMNIYSENSQKNEKRDIICFQTD